ncbi:MAG TPA: D-alanyl-D-alanine carboxypeptidase family protein [Gammaproteobacteria bacterium]|nr:D-alanyl-D-alanine carboxypeptidase family protein [Gammaproteobacteria bacterium]
MLALITRLTIFLVLCSKAVGSPTTPSIAPTPPAVAASAYLLLDFNSNKILAEKNSTLKVEPASLTKMMTMYIVDSEIKAGKIKLTDQVTISKNAWKAPGTRMFVQVGTAVKVEDLIKGVIIDSGNDASVALAEHIAGSEQVFADLMNSYAQMLGMTDSHFMNATGLPHKEHVTTARDMAILARAIIKNFPDSYRLYAEKEFTYNGIKQTNRNLLLWRNSLVDGIKTGHTDSAGYCLVASGKDNNNMRLISIVMGTKSDNARTEEANKLLNWGFRFFETHLVLKAGDALQRAQIYMGSKKKVSIGFTDDLYITTVHGDYKKFTATTNVVNLIKAPVKKGDIVGMYIVQNGQKETIVEQPIVALSDVRKGNILQRSRDYISLNVKALYTKYGS